VSGTAVPRYGVWLFYAASPTEARTAARALAHVDGTRVERVGRHYFVVRTTTQLAPRALIRRGVSLRLAWKQAVPSNHRVDELLLADREVLRGAAACVPYGELGDPDISPHWPPVTTTHQ
jgi:hypothetical protein